MNSFINLTAIFIIKSHPTTVHLPHCVIFYFSWKSLLSPPYRPIYMWKSLLWIIKNILLFSQHLQLTDFIVNRFQHHLSILSARKLRPVLFNHFDDLHFWFNFLNFILECVRMHINQLILFSKKMWIKSLSELIF